MTTDQLAQLRAIAEQYTANAVRIDYREREIALAALPRLLEEREDLLYASARLDAWIARTISGELDTEARSALADFRNAIAKARAP